MFRHQSLRMTLTAVATVLLFAAVGHAELTDSDVAFLNKKILARWELTGKGQLAEAYARGIDVLPDHPDLSKGYFPILIDAAELNTLLDDGYKITVDDYDMYSTYAAKGTDAFGGFRTYSEIIGFLDSIQSSHSNIMTEKFSIGFTFEGNQQWVVKISDNPLVDESEPEVFFNALHHSREPAGGAVLVETIRRLVDGYGTDSLITYLVDNREIFILAVVNPDGYLYNEAIAAGGGGMWRKNRQDFNAPTFGVDLNRNYGYKWAFDDGGSSPDPSSETYRGTSAFSEPETQNMRAFINSRNFVFTINYHSYSDLYLWPWGYDMIYSPDQALFQAIGDSLSTFNGYAPDVSWTLYTTNGEADDWNYGATGEHAKILPFTPEIGSFAEGQFWPEPQYIQGQIDENQEPNMLIISLADAPARIFPAEIPVWTSPDEVDSSDFTLTWSDPGAGGDNQAVSYQLRELFGLARVADDAEAGSGLWSVKDFTISTAHAVSGTKSYYGGNANGLRARLLANGYLHVETDDTLKMNLWYEIETDWDYGYVEISTDAGATWATLAGNVTTTSNPHGNNLGDGLTGFSGGWVAATFPLTAYAGQNVRIRLSYQTDSFVLEEGIYFDDITPVIALDSAVIVEAATPTASSSVIGRELGSYFFDLRATDGDGQTGGQSPPHTITVNSTGCVCACHAEPACDGALNVLDVVGCVNVAFRGFPSTLDADCPRERTDVNCDDLTNVLDVVSIVNVAFRGGDPAIQFCNACTE